MENMSRKNENWTISLDEGYTNKDIVETFFKDCGAELRRPKTYEEITIIEGYWINDDSVIKEYTKGTNEPENHNVFKTFKQAESARAKAKLSQEMAVYNDGWEADYSDGSLKYVIKRRCSSITTDTAYNYYQFLSFKTPELADEFLQNFEEDIKTYFEL